VQVESPSASSIPAGTIVILGALCFGAFRQGAYHEWQLQVFVAVVGLGAVMLAFVSHARAKVPAAALFVAPLFASSALSTYLSLDRSDARSTFLLIGLTAIALVAGWSVPRDAFATAQTALIGIACLVAFTAIWGVAAHSTPWGRVTEGVWRGSSSLTYSNAAAGLLGPAIALTFSRAAIRESRGDAIAAVLLAVGFASTQSRGGALAFLLVTPVILFRLGWRRSFTTGVPVAVGVAIGTPLLIMRSPTTAEPTPILVSALVLLGVGVTGALWPQRERLARPLPVAIAACAGLILAAATPLRDAALSRFTLRSGTTAGGEDAAVLFGDRAKEWAVAMDRISERPLVGHGPGVVDLSWVENGRGFRAYYVHNEFLELAVTNGVIGVLALCIAYLAFRRHYEVAEETRPLLWAMSIYLLHSAFDFLWHLPALPVFFALLAGLALSRSASEPSIPALVHAPTEAPVFEAAS